MSTSSPSDNLSDEEYITGVQRADERVFTHLVRSHIHGLTTFAYSIVKVEDAAHDIVQEVFARIWQLASEWSPKNGVTPYLFTAVKNRSVSWLRSNNAHKSMLERVRATIYEQDISPNEHSDNPYVSTAMLKLIRREMSNLTERQRLALQLRYEQQLPVASVASVLGISVRPTEKLIARALATLRRNAEPHWEKLE